MRVEIAIVVFALAVGLLAGLLVILFGYSFALGSAAGLTVGTVLSVCLLMGYGAVDSIREPVKQIAVWLGIVVLLPLSVWYGTSAISPPPDRKEYSRSIQRLDERIEEAKDEAGKEQLRREKERLEEELDEAERVYYGQMFWVAYPVGLLAFIAGIFFPVQAVGAGLMFGGLSSLAAGCYSYWDRMDAWLRFGSLVIALVGVLVLGTWRFWPVRPRNSPAA